MAYEAMLAGLELTPFPGGIKVKDLVPKLGKESMTHLYTPLEYATILIKWENHIKDRPPLLNDSNIEGPQRTSEKPRAEDYDFSRSALSVSLTPILSLIEATKSVASQTTQADLRPPKVAFIGVPRRAGQASFQDCKPTRIMAF